MSDNLGSSIFQPTSLPNFAVKIDDKYICVKCKGFLTAPVRQTACGHRMCSDCLNQLTQSGQKKCPGNEEDCVDDISINVFPDFGIEREMKKLKVYCNNKPYGCDAVIPWKGLQEHLLQCSFTPVDCTYITYGCDTKISLSQLEEHVNSCMYRPIRCQYCGQDIPRLQMEQGHEGQCASSPKECRFKSMGCPFTGTKEQLDVHLQDHAKHIEVLMSNLAETQLNDTRLRSQIQELKNENDMLKTKMEDSLKETKKMKTQYDHKMKGLQKVTASNAEKVLELQKLEEPAKFVANLQDVSRIHESRITTLETKQRSGDVAVGGIPDDVGGKIRSLESAINMHDVRLAEYDLRFQCLETGSYNGTLVWKIGNYNRRKHEAVTGRTLSLYSQPFYSSRFGYKMCARVYLNGDGMGKGTHISLFFVIMKGDYDALLPWPFKQKVTMCLMDQSGGKHNLVDTFRPDSTSTSFKRPTAEMNVASGCPLFATHQIIENGSYLKDDTIFIKLSIDCSDLNYP